jgi:hypothetical protein
MDLTTIGQRSRAGCWISALSQSGVELLPAMLTSVLVVEGNRHWSFYYTLKLRIGRR